MATKVRLPAIWTQAQRQMVADALVQAQGLLEDELGYPLCPRWITDERHAYRPVLLARWGKVIQAGVSANGHPGRRSGQPCDRSGDSHCQRRDMRSGKYAYLPRRHR